MLFLIILKALRNGPEKEKEWKFIKEVMCEKNEWKGLIEKLKKDFGLVVFIIVLFLDFAKRKREIIEILL